MPPPARAVPEEVIEEILLRLPPHKPACLVRASVVSKLWLGLLSDARFRRRYREFHGAPPMLGVLISRRWESLEPKEAADPIPPFVSTTKFRPRIPEDGWGGREYAVWDCRHGRVLLGEKNAAPMTLAVWDPMTGRKTELREPDCMKVEHHEDGLLGAAVLCAVSGCDHRDCHMGPSRVVFFSLHGGDGAARFVAQACESLLEPGDCNKHWSEPCSALPIACDDGFIEPKPPVLVKDAVHFMLAYPHDYDDDQVYDDYVRVQILRYDLSSNSLSLVDAPSAANRTFSNSALMAMEDGSLGFAHWKKLTLSIWSRQMGFDGVAAWTRRRVISLRSIPPIKDPHKGFALHGSLEGGGVIFVSTKLDIIYKINLKTLRRKKIWKGGGFHAVIPYMSFYNPQERLTTCDLDS